MRIIYHLLNQIQMPLDTAAFHEEMEENFFMVNNIDFWLPAACGGTALGAKIGLLLLLVILLLLLRLLLKACLAITA